MIEIKVRMTNKTLGVSAVGLLLLILNGSALAQDVPALQELGKHIFFDNISSPPRQSCSTCHVAENGWTGGVAGINKKGVAIPGANPHTVGGRKPPSNAYASFSPPFGTRPATNPNPSPARSDSLSVKVQDLRVLAAFFGMDAPKAMRLL